MLLVAGVSCYATILTEAGSPEFVGDWAAGLGVAAVGALVLCYVGGVVSAFASSTALLPVIIPIAVPLVDDGGINAALFVAALAVSSTIVDVSPFSTNGALMLANSNTRTESRQHDTTTYCFPGGDHRLPRRARSPDRESARVRARLKPGTNAFRSRSPEHLDDESFPGLLMLRVEGRLFFFNAEHIAEKIRSLMAEAKPRAVLIDLSGVFDLEYSALKMLTEAERRNREGGVTLWLAGLAPDVYTHDPAVAPGRGSGA